MRVVAGSASGRTLKAPRGGQTRPTADKTKQALFSMVESLLAWADAGWEDVPALDLYAGSGSLGIEALSRGAPRAVFVESDAGALAAIRENLRATQLSDRAEVIAGALPRALGRMRGPIALVLMDPPYADAAAIAVAEEAAGASWLDPDAILALEHGARGGAAPGILGSLVRQRSRRHGDSVLTLYARGRFDRAQGGSEDGAVSGDV